MAKMQNLAQTANKDGAPSSSLQVLERQGGEVRRLTQLRSARAER